MPQKAFVVFFAALLSVNLLNSQSDIFSKTRALIQSQQWEKATELIDKEVPKAEGADKELLVFQKAYAFFMAKKQDSGQSLFEELKVSHKLLLEYVLFYLGQIQLEKKELSAAQVSFEAVLEKKPNARLKNETMLSLSQVLKEQKNFKKAHEYLEKVEKGARGTEQYPQILFELASLESELNWQDKKCARLTKLYIQYPQFEKTSHWGYDLTKNTLNQAPSQCSWDIDDFKKRVRNSLWAGLEKKALDEITQFKKDNSGKQDFEADKILAIFYAQEGDLDKSYEILKKYLSERQNDHEFISQIAPVAARSGDLTTAVTLYYRSYKMQGNTGKGLQALFQAAFMSYQNRDYDWAGRQFKNFIKKSSNEKLKKESQWYLAWMRYLRGEYQLAYNDFKKLSQVRNKKRFKSLSQDRLTYWMGMSQLRMGKADKAKGVFEKLATDRKRGYYAVAASKRLEKLNVTLSSSLASGNQSEDIVQTPFNGHFRSGSASRMVASTNEIPLDEENGVDLGEAEEEADPMEMQAPEETVAETDESPFKTPELVQKFEKSRALMVVGLDQWSKWELYEIEKRTKNKDYLKVLMSEYAMTGQYHRMSHISQIYFAQQKSQLGLHAGRSLWEFSYPKAYSQWVDQYSKEFEVSKELVWSIMKAESQYKREAISPVGALGLMQVMPYTGARVAEILGEKSFTPSQLLTPESAIRIGTKYLQRLNRKFNQALPLVAASYNAGPHRVKNWIQQFGVLETDEFIEHIPFLETRNYVKKVISNSYIYAELYKEKSDRKTADLVPFLAEKMPFTLKDKAPTKETWEEI